MKIIEFVVSKWVERVLKEIEELSNNVELNGDMGVVEQAKRDIKNKSYTEKIHKKALSIKIMNEYFE